MSGGVLIYGGTGYTGRLIAEHARINQHSPIIAGRNTNRVQALAAKLRVEGRVASVSDPKSLDDMLSDIAVLINAASPFSETARPLIESCLRTRTHYLDITGELPTFRDAFGYDAEARERGIMIMPGAGLGIVASDCLALHVASRIPDAKYLRLGLLRPERFSRGSFRSALGMSGSRVTIRRNGRLTSVPVGQLQRSFDYGDGERESVAVSWADVFTAHYSTGIRNIEAYFEADLASRIFYQLGATVADAVRLAPVQRWLTTATEAWPEGPTPGQREAENCVIVAEAEDSWRQRASTRLETTDGYSFTAEAATSIAQRIVRGDFLPGFQTPAKVYGADFVLGIKGTRRTELNGSRADTPSEHATSSRHPA
jgi:short subunit dehydrogenase-like uncharacterized protein